MSVIELIALIIICLLMGYVWRLATNAPRETLDDKLRAINKHVQYTRWYEPDEKDKQ